MHILCITDLLFGSNESLIEGIFQSSLKGYATVTVVYFSKEISQPVWQGTNLVIPYRLKRRGAAVAINKIINFHTIDIIIVRNFFSVLRSFLKIKNTYSLQIGFWNTFPHTFRRYFQAQLENKSLFRKRIEYFWRSFWEYRLVQQCNFLIVMSPEFKVSFFNNITIPWLSIPMGFKSDDLPQEPLLLTENVPKRFIYIGTVDTLRQTELLVNTMTKLEEDFLLDIYTQSNNDSVNQIRKLGDHRIRVLPPLERKELYAKMVNYDLGIGLIPENDLFNVSSPTKVIEYYAVGLPALINNLPEYRALFDATSAVICDFSAKDISRSIREIIKMPKNKLVEMGRIGQFEIKRLREYSILSQNLFTFLGEICQRNSNLDKK